MESGRSRLCHALRNGVSKMVEAFDNFAWPDLGQAAGLPIVQLTDRIDGLMTGASW
jgi:hypothetical protein